MAKDWPKHPRDPQPNGRKLSEGRGRRFPWASMNLSGLNWWGFSQCRPSWCIAQKLKITEQPLGIVKPWRLESVTALCGKLSGTGEASRRVSYITACKYDKRDLSLRLGWRLLPMTASSSRCNLAWTWGWLARCAITQDNVADTGSTPAKNTSMIINIKLSSSNTWLAFIRDISLSTSLMAFSNASVKSRMLSFINVDRCSLSLFFKSQSRERVTSLTSLTKSTGKNRKRGNLSKISALLEIFLRRLLSSTTS